MKKIFQTDTTRARGNCLQAAVASYFDKKDISEVPEFNMIFEWRQALARYLFDRHGRHVVSVCLTSASHRRAVLEKLKTGKGECLVMVESFQYPNSIHAVVGSVREGKLTIIHDPNPANAERLNHEYYVWEIFFIS